MQIQSAHLGEPYTISINIVRKWSAVIGRNKSTWPAGIPAEILKLGWEAMLPYLARLLDIIIMLLRQGSGKRSQWFLYKGGDRSVVAN